MEVSHHDRIHGQEQEAAAGGAVEVVDTQATTITVVLVDLDTMPKVGSWDISQTLILHNTFCGQIQKLDQETTQAQGNILQTLRVHLQEDLLIVAEMNIVDSMLARVEEETAASQMEEVVLCMVR
jgi:hypothetical protein